MFTVRRGVARRWRRGAICLFSFWRVKNNHHFNAHRSVDKIGGSEAASSLLVRMADLKVTNLSSAAFTRFLHTCLFSGGRRRGVWLWAASLHKSSFHNTLPQGRNVTLWTLPSSFLDFPFFFSCFNFTVYRILGNSADCSFSNSFPCSGLVMLMVMILVMMMMMVIAK